MAKTQARTAGQLGRQFVLTTAYELDNFVAVAAGDLRPGPLRAGQDFQVAFDGDASRVQSERFKKLQDSSAVNRRSGFAVYNDRDSFSGFHGF